MSREKRDKREIEYPVQLESQFIVRMPEEPGKVLGELIKSGDNFKNRFQIQINEDQRQGEVRLDHWLLQAKIVDLPTIVESWKTIDRKSLYKSADICQIMLCKDKFDEIVEDDSSKHKKKDPLKVDKKYLWPHGMTPPTKNVRKRRFRKTLKKKCAEAPEIEKEVKRLLRADNEALSYTWEVIGEEDGNIPKNEIPDNSPQATKVKKDASKNISITNQMSKEEDIFGGTLSDSDIEDENINVGISNRKLSSHYELKPDAKPVKELKAEYSHAYKGMKSDVYDSNKKTANKTSYSQGDVSKIYYELDNRSNQLTISPNLTSNLQEIVNELEELKQRKQRTQLEISRIENMTLRQRFEDLLKTINKEITIKEMEYNKLKSSTK